MAHVRHLASDTSIPGGHGAQDILADSDCLTAMVGVEDGDIDEQSEEDELHHRVEFEEDVVEEGVADVDPPKRFTTGKVDSILKENAVLERPMHVVSDDYHQVTESVFHRVRNRLLYGKTVQITQLVCSFLACLLVLLEAYMVLQWWWVIVWYILGLIFAFNWFVECFAKETAQQRLHHMRSWMSLVDYITVVVIYFGALRPLNFLRALRVLRLYRAAHLFSFTRTNIYFVAVYKLLFSFMAFAFISVIAIHRVEGLPPHTALYFFIVTVTTVGYGDITPKTELGRAVVILLLCYMFVVLPVQSGALLDLILSASRYGGAIPRDQTDHVIVVGSVTPTNLGNLANELFHPDKPGRKRFRVVVLYSEEPSPAMERLLRRHEMLTYLTGSPINSEDLDRASASNASACFILCDRRAPDQMKEDSNNILRALAVRKHSRRIPIFAQVLLPSNKRHFRLAATTLFMCITELKFGLMAKSLHAPGATTLLSNLFITSHVHVRRQAIRDCLSRSLRCCIPGRMTERWVQEYSAGMDMEIYVCKYVSRAFIGLSYADVLEYLCAKHRTLLLGVVSKGIVVLNPGPRTAITENTKLIVIAPNSKYVRAMKRLEEGDVQPSSTGTLMESASGTVELQQKKSRITVSQQPTTFHVIETKNQEDCTFDKVPHLKDHIVICGAARGLFYLIAPLRVKKRDLREIVIIAEEPLPRSTWEAIADFSEIYVVLGSSHTHTTLDRAGIRSAGTAIILHDEEDNVQVNEYLVDSNAILTYMAISYINPLIDLRIEIGVASNVSLFVPKGRRPRHLGKEEAFFLMPTYADGTLFTDSTLDTLLAQVYHNPHMVRIAQLLIHSTLLQLVSIPEGFENGTVAEVRAHLLHTSGWLMFAVFRSPAKKVASSFYVVTNPPDSFVLSPMDRLYVLLSLHK